MCVCVFVEVCVCVCVEVVEGSMQMCPQQPQGDVGCLNVLNASLATSKFSAEQRRAS